MQYKKLSKDKFSQKVSFEAMTEFMNILSTFNVVLLIFSDVQLLTLFLKSLSKYVA